jgi:hypothetical protein
MPPNGEFTEPATTIVNVRRIMVSLLSVEKHVG